MLSRQKRRSYPYRRGGGGVNCLRFWHNLPSSHGERTFIPWGTNEELRSLTEHLDGKKAKGRDAGWCLNAPTKWQQGTSISSTVVGQPSWTRTDTCIMPSGLDTVIGKPIGLENLCRPLFCTPGDTKIVKGPINTADPGPTTQPGPTTDPGPTDEPRTETSTIRYKPDLSTICSTHRISQQVSYDGGKTWGPAHGGRPVNGEKDCSASDDDDDTTEETDGDDTGGGDTNGGDTNGGDTAPETWTPHRNTVCYPDVFTQTSSLGDHITRSQTGTKLIDECQLSCPDVPDPSSICVGETEQWTCDGEPSRTIVGTSNAYPCPATCVPDPDPTPSSLCVGDHVIVTCSYGVPRDVYGTSNDCPPCESSKCAAICDQTYLAPDGSDPQTFALGCPSGTTFMVTNDCRDQEPRQCTGPRYGYWHNTGREWANRPVTPRPSWMDEGLPIAAASPYYGVNYFRDGTVSCTIPARRVMYAETMGNICFGLPDCGATPNTTTYYEQECR